MPLATTERCCEEDVDEAERSALLDHPCTERHDVRIVVLTCEARRLLVERERTARARNLVRRDRLSISRAADHDREAAELSGSALGRGEAIRRVVVVRVEGDRAVVDDLV